MTTSRKPPTRRPAAAANFEELHREFRPKILGYLKRLIGGEEAEDLTQEVFLKVDRSLGKFQGRSQWSTWIYRIATNAAIDRMRAPGSRLRTPPKPQDKAWDGEDRNVWTGAKSLSPDEQVMLKEMFECFREFIDKLPAAYRTVLVLSEWEGFTPADIAKILGLSLDTVKIRLHRGRRQLYDDLRSHCSPKDWPFELVGKKS